MKQTDDAQLYTIEGFAAALIMIITAFLVVNATSVYTAGDTHISDMQLEVAGTDALKMMDIAPNGTTTTPLQQIIEADPVDGAKFNAVFSQILQQGSFGNPNDIHYNATFTCRNNNVAVPNNPIFSNRNLTEGEHPVRVTKWVIVNKDITACPVVMGKIDRAVLVEVLLWRD